MHEAAVVANCIEEDSSSKNDEESRRDTLPRQYKNIYLSVQNTVSTSTPPVLVRRREELWQEE